METEICVTNTGKCWHKKGNKHYYHREDGPAMIFNSGLEFWYYYGKSYDYPKYMPLNIFLAYCKWEYRKNGN